MPGDKYRSIQNPAMYRALRRKRGFSKEAAARISNGRTPGHTVKASPNYGARAGQTIVGNLARGGDGKFTSGGTGGPTARQQRSQQRRDTRAQRANERAAASDQAGRDEDTRRAQEDAYIAGGKNGRERQRRRAEVAQARRERATQRREAARQRREQERQTRAQEDAAERAAREAEAKKPKGGGGGGGKGKPSEEEKRAEQERTKRETAAQTAQQVGLKPAQVEALRRAAETGSAGVGMDVLRDLETSGLTSDGEATDQGRRALAALERGDQRGYLAAVQDGKARIARQQAADERRGATERARVQREQERTSRAAQRQAERERRAQERERRAADRAIGQRRVTAVKGFRVFKDAGGRDRWVSISSTAYRDRDAEIVSTQALAGAVTKADASGARGPLRWWHVPGLDIGDCDFQMVAGPGGRYLVESGTFRDPRYAAALKGAGPLQVSIGFVHPRDQPGRDGVFSDIAIFERSVVPDGRAANPMTRLTLKERRMSADKIEAARALFGEELLGQLLSTVATTDKEAQAQGVAFKEAEADPLAALQAQVAELTATVKALTEKAAMPPAEMVAAGDTEAEDGAVDLAEDAGETSDTAEELMSDEAFIAAIADAVVTRIAPMFDMEKKMRGMVDELKGAMGGYATKDDTQAQLATLAADVATLKGETPRAAQGALAPQVGTPVPPEVAEQFKAANGEAWQGVASFAEMFAAAAAARATR